MMSTNEIRSEIQKSLDSMNGRQLQSAWRILKELGNQEHYEEWHDDKQLIDKQIEIGIQQLDNGEGRNFAQFLHEMEVKYGNQK